MKKLITAKFVVDVTNGELEVLTNEEIAQAFVQDASTWQGFSNIECEVVDHNEQ